MTDDSYVPRHRADVPTDYIRLAPARTHQTVAIDETHRFIDFSFVDLDRRSFDAQVRVWTNAHGPGDWDDPMVEQ